MIIPAISERGVGGTVNKQIQSKLSQQTLSGLLILLDSVETAGKVQLNVAVRLDGIGQEILIPSMPLFPLYEKADMEGGTSLSAVFEKVLEGTASGHAAEIKSLACIIDLGQINLSGKDELDIQATITGAFTADDGITVAVLDFGMRPENILKYVEQNGGNARFSNPESAFIYRTAAEGANDRKLADLAAGELNVSIKAGEKSFSYDARMAWALSAAAGSFEVSGPRRTAMVYSDRYTADPGADVTLTLTGSDRASWSCFAVERFTHPERAAVKHIEVLQHVTAKAEKLEISKPHVAQAMVLQGKAVPAATMRNALSNVTQAMRRYLK